MKALKYNIKEYRINSPYWVVSDSDVEYFSSDNVYSDVYRLLIKKITEIESESEPTEDQIIKLNNLYNQFIMIKTNK